MRIKVIVIIFLISVLYTETSLAEDYKSTTTLNVRSGPSKEYTVVFKLKKGDNVILIKKHDDNWYEIQQNGKTGFVFKEYLVLDVLQKDLQRDLEEKYFPYNLTTRELGYIILGIIVLAIMLVVIISIFGKNRRAAIQYHNPSNSVAHPTYHRAPKYNEIRSTKSVALAVILVFLFGPFGMFYSTVKGALIMIFLAPVLFGLLFFIGFASDPAFFILFGIGIIIYYPACLIWSGNAANSYNQRINRERFGY